MTNRLFAAMQSNNNKTETITQGLSQPQGISTLATFTVTDFGVNIFVPRNEKEAEYLGLFDNEDGSGQHLRLSFSHGQVLNGESVHTYGRLVMFNALAEHLATQLISSGKHFMTIRVSARLRVEENVKGDGRFINNVLVAYGYSDSSGKYYTTRNGEVVIGNRAMVLTDEQIDQLSQLERKAKPATRKRK